MRTIATTLLAFLLACAPAHAGYRNLLLHVTTPPEGYTPGTTIPVLVTVDWLGLPMPGVLVALLADRVGPLDRPPQRWLFRTDENGEAIVTLELSDEDPGGWWYVAGFLVKPLPDETGDGDVVTIHVVEP